MATKTATAVKIVRVPSFGATRGSTAMAPRKSNAAAIRRKFEDRLASIRARARKVAGEEKHRITAAAAAGAIALAEAYLPDVMDKLSIGPLRPAATLGIAMFAAERMGLVRGKTFEHATTGVLSVGVYQTVSEAVGTAGTAGSFATYG